MKRTASAALVCAVLAISFVLIWRERASTIPPKTVHQAPVHAGAQIAPRIRSVTGAPFIKRGTSLYRATSSIELAAGDVIQTGPTSTVDVLWPAYGHSLIGNSSVVAIDDTANAPQGFIAKLSLQAGRVWNRIQRILGPESFFGVRASTVASVVRGTSFGVALLPSAVNVQVTESTVGVFHSAPSDDPFLTNGAETRVEKGMETDAPLDPSSEIPAPRGLSAQERRDPFILTGAQDVPAAELNATTSGTTLPASSPTRTVAVIEYQGREISLDQLHIGHAHAPNCDADHYHATLGYAAAIDGTLIVDPGNCGYGKVPETPTIQLEIH